MEKINFENSRGLELAGNYWNAGSDTAVVMSHGFTGNKEEWGKFTRIAEKFNSAGFTVLAFDFSGCGESEDDSITIQKEVDDLNSAIDYVKSRGAERVGLFGLSQGGLITLETYKKRQDGVSAIVLLAPLTDAIPDYRHQKFSQTQRENLEKKGYTVRTRKKGERDRFVIPNKLIERKENLDQDELVSGVECPVLFIHGAEDSTVPLEHSEGAVKNLNKAEIQKIEDDHYFEESVDEVAKLSERWFKEHLPL